MSLREQARRVGEQRLTERELWFYSALIIGSCGDGLWARVLTLALFVMWWWTR